MKALRRSVVGVVFTAALLLPAGTAFAAQNPSPTGTGLPSQSCQDIEAVSGPSAVPGNAASSPGSPFNEPGINTTNGGTGGQHYNATSQYDVACYQHSQH